MLARRVADQYHRIGELTEALREWDREVEPQLADSVDLTDLAAHLAGRGYRVEDVLPARVASASAIADLAGDLDTVGDAAFLDGLRATDQEAAARVEAALAQSPGYDQYWAASGQPDDAELYESWVQLGEPTGARAILDGLLATADPPTAEELDQARQVVAREPLEVLLEGDGLTEPVHRLILSRYAQRGSVVPEYLLAAGVQPADLTATGAVGAWVNELWAAWEADGFPEGDEGFWAGLKHI